jgi:large subunit ribosomal protein L3
VVEHKTDAKDGYNAVVIGFRDAKEKHVNKPQLGMFETLGVAPKRILKEFRVTADAFPPIGGEITAMHFIPGQKVNVRAKTKGKGFAGVMKRWNFAGGNASHGASKSHRQIGSTGAATDPAHVHKGKKMPGRMGGKYRTTQNLTVFRVVPEMNMIAVIGHVPGAENGIVEVWDSNKKWKEPLAPPPFPAYIRKPSDKIKHYSEIKDGEKITDLTGPMPLPHRLAVMKEAGWHIPSPQEIKEAVARGRVHHIATGETEAEQELAEEEEEEEAAEEK